MRYFLLIACIFSWGLFCTQHTYYVDYYKVRYLETDVFKKITDNKGNGNDLLYGTRNLRPVLHGLAYRGGANNYYHKDNRRHNHNPLPEDGIYNLCREKFSHAVYLYRQNFSTVDTVNICIVKDTNGLRLDTLKYSQLDYFNSKHIKKMLQMVYENILHYKGPMYFHCWNGWHASGYIAAILLKQFCGFSDNQAVDYWDRGTDGANKSPAYQVIRDSIHNFVPHPEYLISDALSDAICPYLNSDSVIQNMFSIDILLTNPEAIPVDIPLDLGISFFKHSSKISLIQRKTLDLIIEILQIYPEMHIALLLHRTSDTLFQKRKFSLRQYFSALLVDTQRVHIQHLPKEDTAFKQNIGFKIQSKGSYFITNFDKKTENETHDSIQTVLKAMSSKDTIIEKIPADFLFKKHTDKLRIPDEILYWVSTLQIHKNLYLSIMLGCKDETPLIIRNRKQETQTFLDKKHLSDRVSVMADTTTTSVILHITKH